MPILSAVVRQAQFVIALLAMVGLLVFFPDIALWLPRMVGENIFEFGRQVSTLAKTEANLLTQLHLQKRRVGARTWRVDDRAPGSVSPRNSYG